MKKIFFVILFFIIILDIKFIYKFRTYDSISAATSSSSSSGDSSKSSQKKHKSNALKVILNSESKKKFKKLEEQINNSFSIKKSLRLYLKDPNNEFDIMEIYLLVENNNSIISSFNEEELKKIKNQLKKIDEIIPDVNKFLDQFDRGDVNESTFFKIKNKIEVLSEQYRAIQWVLYI